MTGSRMCTSSVFQKWLGQFPFCSSVVSVPFVSLPTLDIVFYLCQSSEQKMTAHRCFNLNSPVG